MPAGPWLYPEDQAADNQRRWRGHAEHGEAARVDVQAGGAQTHALALHGAETPEPASQATA